MLRIMSTVITMILTKVTVISSMVTQRRQWGERNRAHSTSRFLQCQRTRIAKA